MVLVCVPHGVLDTYWTDLLTLSFYAEHSVSSRGSEHADETFEKKWGAAVGRATNVSVAINLGQAVGQVLGGLLGVHFAYAQLLEQQGQQQQQQQRHRHSEGYHRLGKHEGAQVDDDEEGAHTVGSKAANQRLGPSGGGDDDQGREGAEGAGGGGGGGVEKPPRHATAAPASDGADTQRLLKRPLNSQSAKEEGETGGGRLEEEGEEEEELKLGSLKHMYAFMVLVYAFAPVPFLYVLAFAQTSKGNFARDYVATDFGGGVLRGLNEPLIKEMLIALSPRDMLGAGAAVLTITTELGRGLGPGVVSSLVRSQGRSQAFATAFFVWVFAALVLLVGLCAASDRDAATVVLERTQQQQQQQQQQHQRLLLDREPGRRPRPESESNEK